MIFKIIRFTKFDDGEDNDCVAITDHGKEITVDPFVGCAFEYEGRTALLNSWFEVKSEHWHQGVLLPAENDFTLVNNSPREKVNRK